MENITNDIREFWRNTIFEMNLIFPKPFKDWQNWHFEKNTRPTV